MTNTVSEQNLDDATNEFSKKFEEWKEMPDKINRTVDALKYGNLAVWAYVTPHRDSAQDGLKKLLEKLQEVADGIAAPYTFIARAAEWRDQVGAEIRSAGNDMDRSDLGVEGYWKGNGKDAYVAARGYQVKAATSANDIAVKLATSMEDLARSGLELYTTIATTLTAQLTKLLTACEQTGSVILAYEGAPGMVAAINDTLNTVVQIVAAIAKNAQGQMITTNQMKDAANNPWGFPDDRWPQSVVEGYNEPDQWEKAR